MLADGKVSLADCTFAESALLVFSDWVLFPHEMSVRKDIKAMDITKIFFILLEF